MRYGKSGEVDFFRRFEDSKMMGRVHSTFNRTFNMQCPDNDELYTIACSHIDNAPNTLIIDLDSLVYMDIEVNDIVYVEENKMIVSNKLLISFENAPRWESRLPAYPKNTQKLNHNFHVMKEYIDLYGTGGGIRKPKEIDSPFGKEMARLLEERTGMLLNELIHKRMSSAKDHAIGLVGLGPGLTPSGDDFLVGLFTILNLQNSPLYPYRKLGAEVIREAKEFTNDISLMALKKASIGKVRESIISLVTAILYGTQEDLILSLNKVLNIGSSSGTDIALGLVCGLEANIKVGGKV